MGKLKHISAHAIALCEYKLILYCLPRIYNQPSIRTSRKPVAFQVGRGPYRLPASAWEWSLNWTCRRCSDPYGAPNCLNEGNYAHR